METSPDVFSSHHPVVRACKEIAFGSVAGMVSKVFEHPFDLAKVRLQSQVLDATARFSGPIDCLTKTWRNEGMRGLYRGLPAPIVGAMAENASLFLAYGELQNVVRRIYAQPLPEKLSMAQLAVAAAGAGAITSFVLTPIELIKCKMQVQMLVNPALASATATAGGSSRGRALGPISVLLSVVRTTGIRGLWLGQTGTLIRETGGTAAWFSTKEFVATYLVNKRTQRDPGSVTYAGGAGSEDGRGTGKPELLVWESAVSGAIAGATFNFVLFPADTVKSAMQTEDELRPRGVGDAKGKGRNFFQTFGAMYRAQGIRGLYAGCGVTVARSIPSSAIIFVIYDQLSRRFG
ncbi:hypothetical protein PLEOSDRAFT_1067174 [Pleurotus ostreatus PC15]|uniref:Mitochondrial carrier n=2 Tax=Pleurotus TaxID=5320 RepID=A0A067NJR5_PLEO1|nr:hypothetical protein CCMSSC00406_0002328 [Pleurotus cornucopiae]KDQ24312.1 hypothetical protein PLEOSDRAFT_1067174 [Pleurotus ostreatus PC15]